VSVSAQGQDRSSFQYVSNWDGLDFGFAKATEGTGWADPTFAANWRNMERDKLAARGAYHFFHPGLDPVKQAEWFVSHVKAQGLKPGDMLVADIEVLSGGWLAQFVKQVFGKRARHQSQFMAPATLAFVDVQAKTFLAEVAKLAGPQNPVIVYTSLYVGAYLVSCTSYPLWIAYPSPRAPLSVYPWKSWTFWQWSFGGAANGSDQDAFNGSRAELAAWIGKYKTPPKPPAPPWTWRRAIIGHLESAITFLGDEVTAANGAETATVQTVDLITNGESVSRALELFREHVK
jgi:lysozyme